MLDEDKVFNKDNIKYDELNRPEVKEMYFSGFKNQAIRVYYYLKQGLDLMNDFKYLVAGILAIYVVLQLDSYKLMLLMGAVSLPILITIGYYWTHKAQKTIEYFNLKFTTHFGQYNIRLQEEQLKTLERLNKSLEEFNRNEKRRREEKR